MEKRTIFIGDIQWCYKELKLLLEKVKLTDKDKVYFVWDLINRGPKSYKVLKFIYNNREQFKAVVWNHEINLLRYLDWKSCSVESRKEFMYLESKFKKNPEILEFVRSLPRYIEEDNFIVLHAWVIPWKTLKEHTIDEITRTREIKWKPWYEYYKWKKKIIYGHWAVDWVRVRKNTVWIDSWCVYWKNLTAYILETWEIYSENALDHYINIYK